MYHYPETSTTMWADVGNSMYGYVGNKLQLVKNWKDYSGASKGDVIETA